MSRSAIEAPELLPCPFCGSTNVALGDFGIECGDCGALGPESMAADPVDRWNTRTSPAPTDAEREVMAPGNLAAVIRAEIKRQGKSYYEEDPDHYDPPTYDELDVVAIKHAVLAALRSLPTARQETSNG